MRVTHSGRHTGAMKAKALGILYDLIKRGGGWKDHLCNGIDHYDGISNLKVIDRHAYLQDTKDRH